MTASDEAIPDLTEAPTVDGGLWEVVGRHARTVESGAALGVHGTLRFSCFVDLLSASHVHDDLELMAKALVGLIQKGLRDDGGPTLIVTPKRGNVLLGKRVADILSLKSAYARDEILAGRLMEGIFDYDDRVVLVDDISSDGELLCDAIASLRRSGLFVKAAVTVINRSDGDAKRKLATEGVQLIHAMELDDSAIDHLIADQKAGILTRRRNQTPNS